MVPGISSVMAIGAADQAVEQGGFAHVGPAHDGDDWLAHAASTSRSSVKRLTVAMGRPAACSICVQRHVVEGQRPAVVEHHARQHQRVAELVARQRVEQVAPHDQAGDGHLVAEEAVASRRAGRRAGCSIAFISSTIRCNTGAISVAQAIVRWRGRGERAPASPA